MLRPVGAVLVIAILVGFVFALRAVYLFYF